MSQILNGNEFTRLIYDEQCNLLLRSKNKPIQAKSIRLGGRKGAPKRPDIKCAIFVNTGKT